MAQFTAHGSGEHLILNGHEPDRDARMHQWLSGIVSTAEALRSTQAGRPLFAATVMIFGVNGWTALSSRNMVSSLGLILSILALLYNFWDSWKKRNQVALTRSLTEALSLTETQVRIIEGLQAAERNRTEQLRQEAALREQLEFEVAQISAELLRERGFMKPSGNREPLRPAVPPSAVEVLIVEDEQSIRRLLIKILGHYGFQVAESATVREALEMIRGRDRVGPRFDFVVLDLQLPDGSGLDVLRMVHAGRPGTDVIITSGALDEDVLEAARRWGAAAVLVKPIVLAELLALLGIVEEDLIAGDGGSNDGKAESR